MLRKISRDNARTPMQWSSGKNAGFTNGVPWLSVNQNYDRINAESALKDKNSVFHYYRKLIRIRKANRTLIYGKYQLILGNNPVIYAYTRSLGREKIVVLLNFTTKNSKFKLPEYFRKKELKLITGNYPNTKSEILRPYEAVVYSTTQKRF